MISYSSKIHIRILLYKYIDIVCYVVPTNTVFDMSLCSISHLIWHICSLTIIDATVLSSL